MVQRISHATALRRSWCFADELGVFAVCAVVEGGAGYCFLGQLWSVDSFSQRSYTHSESLLKLCFILVLETAMV